MSDDEILLTFPSDAPTPALAEAFPRVVVDVERAVYEYVLAATQQNLPDGLPALSFYADRAQAAAEGLRVPVVRGWPPFPGDVPALGVAAGTETEDQQSEVIQGGFAGESRAYVPHHITGDPTTTLLGAADYYTEPLYSPITIELVHENRDERDRLHNELRMLMVPAKMALMERCALIKRVRVDAEKTEAPAGVPGDEMPIIGYLSLFTVHVYSEVLMPRDIVGADGVVGRIDVSVAGADTGP